MKFNELALNPQLLEAISYMDFETATPIQEQAIPPILDGKDIIACAQTGTGKTAAFLLPVIHHLLENNTSGTSTLIIVPTRELAIQTDQQIQGVGYFADISSVAIYGGGDGDNWETQRKALTSDTNIVVATPGKLISHLNMGYVKFDSVRFLVLDEADRMLDIGFYDDILKILSFLPQKRQAMMFSATMPPKVRTLAKKILDNNPHEVNISISKPAEGVLQAAYLVYDKQKTALIHNLLKDKPEYNSILIFSSTKKKVNEIVAALKKGHQNVQGISSDLEQEEREEVLRQFKARNTRILVATDVLSRGIDIKDINLIINYDVPGDAEDYVHRVGRTARAETTGVALTLINPADMEKFQRIEGFIENEIHKIPLPKELGEGPGWFIKTRNTRKPGNNFRKPNKKGSKKGFNKKR
jgi:superfamily II DNA/RNA helicase